MGNDNCHMLKLGPKIVFPYSGVYIAKNREIGKSLLGYNVYRLKTL